MTSEDEHGALVRDAVSGDASALKALLVVSQRQLSARLGRRIPADLARFVTVEDMIQETHVQVFRYIRQFEPRDSQSFHRWVATVALNNLRNAIKRHRSAKRGGGRIVPNHVQHNIEGSTIALLDRVAGPGNTPSRCMSRREAVAVLEAAMGRMPEHYRLAVRMVYIEGRSVREVAGGMGRTERAIHGLCRRGLEQLKEELPSASKLFSSPG